MRPHGQQPTRLLHPVPGILQARTLEWVAISFSNAWKWKVKVKLLSRVRLLETPWNAVHQAPASMGFSSKSTGVGCHCLLRKCILGSCNWKRKVRNIWNSNGTYLVTSGRKWARSIVLYRSPEITQGCQTHQDFDCKFYVKELTLIKILCNIIVLVT